MKNGFCKSTYVEVESFPILVKKEINNMNDDLKSGFARANYIALGSIPKELFNGEVDEFIMNIKSIIDDIIKENPQYEKFHILNREGELDIGLSKYEDVDMFTIVGVEKARDMRERRQSKEERKALEQRELALLARLKEKYEKNEEL
jgi:hypothetical protein